MPNNDIYAWLSDTYHAYECENCPINIGAGGSFDKQVEHWQPCGYMSCRVDPID